MQRAASVLSSVVAVLAAQGLIFAYESVPFVGCKSDGQTGPQEAPHGTTVRVATGRSTARELAFYESAQGLGVLAPRGWHCFGVYGSSGDTLYVTSQRIGATDFFSRRRREFTGPVIELSRRHGESSGRDAVASVIARVFPGRHAFVRRVMEAFEMPADSFTTGTYP